MGPSTLRLPRRQPDEALDGDDSSGVHGFRRSACRDAESQHPGVQYSNLAVRGKRISDVRVDQFLPSALGDGIPTWSVRASHERCHPAGRAFHTALVDLGPLHSRLAESGADGW